MWKLNTNCAADELRADATSPPLALCPRSTGFVARGAVAGPLGRAPPQRGPLPLGKDPPRQIQRGRRRGGGPKQAVQASPAPELSSTVPSPQLMPLTAPTCLPPGLRFWRWLSLGWDRQGNLRPQAPLSRTRRLGRTRKQARRSPGQRLPPQPAKPLGDGGGRTVSAVPCTSGRPAPSPGAEDDILATPDKGLCTSLHPPVLAACVLPPRQQAPRLREAHPPLLDWLHSLAWLPTPPELP